MFQYVLLPDQQQKLDEIHQLFVDGRNAQINDLGIDILGLVTGMTLCLFIYIIVKLLLRISKLFKKTKDTKEESIIETTPFTLESD